ncbi:CoA-acylating methylmalonate-semialdehyde dehydrogenase [Anaerolentibacter hominis]|uniref:CoA-acylating methylmalonate-semialdehyde dehydrogenase n=1 Tax=Anaerolentibacter hominis TaxID=3079009 RepID=UPI0031B87B4D
MAEPRILKNYINGEWVESKATQFEDVINPATKEVICRCPLSTREELDYAAEAAQKAFESWKKVPIPRRARFMFRLSQLLEENREELAQLVTLENGKALSESRGEVQRGIENTEVAGSASVLMMGDSLSTIATNVEGTSYRYPVGVVGGIVPFNFPMMVPFWMFPMAITVGNTFILKPSEKAPLCTEKVVSLIEQAGIPKGVFNVVYGAHDVVNGICENPYIKAVSFVGSKSVGAYVYKKATENLKRVQCLTGAKNHTIVLKDTDIDETITNILGAAYGSAGERCMACAVLCIEDAIYDEFMERFVQRSKEVKMGNGLDDGVFLGPVVREENLKRTVSYIEKGIAEGATLVLDGRERMDDKGYFIGPTIFADVTTDMTIWKDEIFAPVVCAVRVKNVQEGVALANQSEFANGACIFTTNANAIRYFRENVDAGMLGINLGVPAPMAMFPFSGWKSSFYGSMHCNGKDGVDFYTRRKVVTARYPEPEE